MHKHDGGAIPAAPTLAARMRRGDLFSEQCPSREILKHVTSRWGVLVLVALRGGTHRFSELRRKISGVSERMLAQTLQWLEADGLVLRDAYVTAAAHCAPPGNRPSPAEISACRPFLVRELRLMTRARVVLALGQIAWDAVLAALDATQGAPLATRGDAGCLANPKEVRCFGAARRPTRGYAARDGAPHLRHQPHAGWLLRSHRRHRRR